MTALAQARICPSYTIPGGSVIPGVYQAPLGIADNVLIYAGALVVRDSSGYVRPARGGTADTALGRARTTYDNTVAGHSAGAILGIDVEIGVFGYINDTGAPILSTTAPGTAIYALDDQTVSLTAGSNCKAGKLWTLGLDGLVYVLVGPAAGWP